MAKRILIQSPRVRAELYEAAVNKIKEVSISKGISIPEAMAEVDTDSFNLNENFIYTLIG